MVQLAESYRCATNIMSSQRRKRLCLSLKKVKEDQKQQQDENLQPPNDGQQPEQQQEVEEMVEESQVTTSAGPSSGNPPNKTIMTTFTLTKTKRTRLRPGTMFFFTIGPLIQFCTTARQDFIDNLSRLYPTILTYCVVVEVDRNSVSREENHYLKAFIEFREPLLLNDLRQQLAATYAGQRLNIKPCKNRKKCLKTITTEDRLPLYNCRLSELDFCYRSFEWATSNATFQHSHPFVQEHWFHHKYLQKLHAAFRKEMVPGFNGFKRVEYWHQNWSLKVIAWWNNNIGKRIKQKQLYLYGDTNTGKSTLIETLIGRANLERVFYPGVGLFFMQEFDETFHKIIVFEKFDLKSYQQSFLKRLLEGMPYSYPVRYSKDKIIKWPGMVILISNTFTIEHPGLLNRLVVVKAESPYWVDGRGPVPKTEEQPVADVVVISSDEDEFL